MSSEEPEPRVTYRRFSNHQYAAMAVSAVTLIASALHGGAEGLVRTILPLLFLLPLILFPEAMGSITGPRFTTEPSHPGALALMAWLLLLFLAVVRVGQVF